MKKIAVLFLFVIFFSCYVEDESFDPTVMPEETVSGEDTFGCLIDGWIYTGGRYGISFISFMYDPDSKLTYVNVKVAEDTYLSFTINNPVENKSCEFTGAKLNDENLGGGTVKITRFDREKRIISGTFSGGRITQGRFDVFFELRAVRQ